MHIWLKTKKKELIQSMSYSEYLYSNGRLMDIPISKIISKSVFFSFKDKCYMKYHITYITNEPKGTKNISEKCLE